MKRIEYTWAFGIKLRLIRFFFVLPITVRSKHHKTLWDALRSFSQKGKNRHAKFIFHGYCAWIIRHESCRDVNGFLHNVRMLKANRPLGDAGISCFFFLVEHPCLDEPENITDSLSLPEATVWNPPPDSAGSPERGAAGAGRPAGGQTLKDNLKKIANCKSRVWIKHAYLSSRALEANHSK